VTTESVLIPITVIEELHLAQLIDDFLELVGTSRSSGDPAIERLTPNPYPDDPDSAADFAGTTRDDILDRRLADARRMRAALSDFDDDLESVEERALTTRDLVVQVDDIDSWLRTLTAIRLVIATRLGITSDDQNGEDGRHDVYDWLGYRLELLIQAADEAGAGLSR
jgi:hypothetical protein